MEQKEWLRQSRGSQDYKSGLQLHAQMSLRADKVFHAAEVPYPDTDVDPVYDQIHPILEKRLEEIYEKEKNDGKTTVPNLDTWVEKRAQDFETKQLVIAASRSQTPEAQAAAAQLTATQAASAAQAAKANTQAAAQAAAAASAAAAQSGGSSSNASELAKQAAEKLRQAEEEQAKAEAAALAEREKAAALARVVEKIRLDAEAAKAAKVAKAIADASAAAGEATNSESDAKAARSEAIAAAALAKEKKENAEKKLQETREATDANKAVECSEAAVSFSRKAEYAAELAQKAYYKVNAESVKSINVKSSIETLSRQFKETRASFDSASASVESIQNLKVIAANAVAEAFASAREAETFASESVAVARSKGKAQYRLATAASPEGQTDETLAADRERKEAEESINKAEDEIRDILKKNLQIQKETTPSTYTLVSSYFVDAPDHTNVLNEAFKNMNEAQKIFNTIEPNLIIVFDNSVKISQNTLKEDSEKDAYVEKTREFIEETRKRVGLVMNDIKTATKKAFANARKEMPKQEDSARKLNDANGADGVITNQMVELKKVKAEISKIYNDAKALDDTYSIAWDIQQKEDLANSVDSFFKSMSPLLKTIVEHQSAISGEKDKIQQFYETVYGEYKEKLNTIKQRVDENVAEAAALVKEAKEEERAVYQMAYNAGASVSAARNAVADKEAKNVEAEQLTPFNNASDSPIASSVAELERLAVGAEEKALSLESEVAKKNKHDSSQKTIQLRHDATQARVEADDLRQRADQAKLSAPVAGGSGAGVDADTAGNEAATAATAAAAAEIAANDAAASDAERERVAALLEQESAAASAAAARAAENESRLRAEEAAARAETDAKVAEAAAEAAEKERKQKEKKSKEKAGAGGPSSAAAAPGDSGEEFTGKKTDVVTSKEDAFDKNQIINRVKQMNMPDLRALHEILFNVKDKYKGSDVEQQQLKTDIINKYATEDVPVFKITELKAGAKKYALMKLYGLQSREGSNNNTYDAGLQKVQDLKIGVRFSHGTPRMVGDFTRRR